MNASHTKYSKICSLLQQFARMQEVITETVIKDEYSGTILLVDATKFSQTNKKLMKELEEFMTFEVTAWNQFQKKSIADFFKIIREAKNNSNLYDFTKLDDSWKNPGAKKVG